MKTEETRYYKAYYSSPFGKILLVSDGKNLCGLWFEAQKYFAAKLGDKMQKKSELQIFIDTKNWLDKYFKGQNPKINEIPLAPQGSDFQKEVWKLLCQIPYGEITTYGEIAKKIAQKLNKKTMSAQAVGNAIGHNPVSIIIPCHRVIGSNGSLTGYAGGLNIKAKLLEIEGITISNNNSKIVFTNNYPY